MFNLNSVLTPEDSKIISEAMCVAAIFPKRGDVFLLPYFTAGEHATKSPDRKPKKYKLNEICNEIEKDKISLDTIKLEDFKEVAEEYLYDKNGNPLPSTIKRDSRYEVVKKLLSYDDELYFPMHGKGAIAIVAKQLKVTRTNAQRYLNTFYRGGRHINSLIPSTGRHSNSPEPGSRKLGRPRLTNKKGIIGKNVTKQDKKHIKRIAKRDYLSQKRLSLKKCYQKLMDECYYKQKGSIAPDGTRTKTEHLHPNEIISENQFRDWIPQVTGLSRNQIRANRRQSSDQKANFAGRAGHSDFQADGPGHYWQMDSTEIDLELVTPYNRLITVLRATIYVVRDVFSRSIVGIHLAHGNASWKEARVALFHAIRNKVEFAKEYGLDISEDDWVEYGEPENLLVDNEEFQNKISESVGKDLNLTVQYARAYQGDDKGLSESSFHMIHSMIKNEEIPGFRYKKLLGRNRNIPLKTACLTVYEMQQILIIYAIYHNNHIWKDNFPLEESAMMSGIKNVCRDYWDWGMENRNYYLTYRSDRQLYLSLLEVGTLTVHRTHLHLQEVGADYYCEEIRSSNYQDRPLVGSSRVHKTLSCRYIRTGINRILIEFKGKLVPGYLHSDFKACRKMSVVEFKEWKVNQEVGKSMHEHEHSGATSDFSVMTNHIVSNAKAKKSEAKKLENKVQFVNKKEASQVHIEESDQKENERLDDAVLNEIEFTQTTSSTAIEIENTPDVDIELPDDDDDDEFFSLMEEE